MNTEKLDNLKSKFISLTAQISDPAVISDNKEWTRLCKEHSDLEPIIAKYDEYLAVSRDVAGAEELIAAETDPDLIEMAKEEIKENRSRLEVIENDLKLLLLPSDPDDDKNVIIEIRGGAGGEEAALFAYEIMRMYKMYAEKKRWKAEDIDVNMTELGGVKEAVFSLSGTDVYSRMKFESGVHRVQRVPETESQGRIHTSTITVAVLPEVEDVKIDINEKDLKIDTYRSSGAGGQHVNKTESAIRITHLPTGIVVCCQDERSQIKNRDRAMSILKSKLYDKQKEEQSAQYSQARRSQVGTGDRSERIRTYNFPQGRVTDHRINLTLYSLDNFLNGDLDEMIEALIVADREAKLASQD